MAIRVFHGMQVGFRAVNFSQSAVSFHKLVATLTAEREHLSPRRPPVWEVRRRRETLRKTPFAPARFVTCVTAHVYTTVRKGLLLALALSANSSNTLDAIVSSMRTFTPLEAK
jgi:hypothetical protein